MSRAKELDQFYTDPLVARICHNFLVEALDAEGLKTNSLAWLEPSVGEGAFFCNMPKRRLGVDLDPKVFGADVRRMNFFHFDPKKHWPEASGRAIVCAGNPPFGRGGALAVRFFNHAATFSQVIALIVPSSFRKPSVQRRLDSTFHQVLDYFLPEKSFIFEGRPYDVPCCFQVWVKRTNVVRHCVDGSLSHPDFEFVPREQASLAVRRVGTLAGKYFLEFSQYADESHYFIRPKIDISRFLALLDEVDWHSLTTANGISPSIGKRAFVRAYTAASENADIV